LDIGLAGINLIGLIVAVFVGTNLINKEIEKKTVLVLIPKPISRVEFIVGKQLGLSAVLAVLVIAMSAVYLGIMTWSQVEYPLGSILVAIVFLMLELFLIIAIALTFGVFTSSLLSTLLAYGVYLMGHSSQYLLDLAKLSKNPELEGLMTAIYLVVPDLSRLDLKNLAVYGILPETPDLLLNALYGLTYIVLLLTISIQIFSRRQF